MSVQKKSSSVAKKTASSKRIVQAKPTKKVVVAKKPILKKPVKRSIKPKSILVRLPESDFKKFADENSDNYHPEDAFEPRAVFSSGKTEEVFNDEQMDEDDEELGGDRDDDEQNSEEFSDSNDDDQEEVETEEKPYNRDDYDFQKKFYRSLSLEAKHKSEEDPVKNTHCHSISFYRKFAIRFTVAVVILIAIVAFFSFSKLTISVVPSEDLINEDLVMSVQDETASSTPDSNSSLKGIVGSLVIEDEKIYSTTGEEAATQDFSGKVVIINTNNTAQALVATTRLLTADNKLFRIKQAVNVPAGGEVEVEVYPDVSSSDMAISPTNFTIPGLNAALRAKIYAESREAFTFGATTKKYVSAEDLSNAKKDLSLALMEKAKAEASEKFKQYDKVIYNVDITKIVTATDAKAGDGKEEFKMKARGSVQIIAFSQADTLKLIEAKLKISIPEGRVLSGLNESSISYSLESADEAQKIAAVKVVFSGRTTFAPGFEIIDRNKIVSLNRDQINDYLKTVDGISAYKLEFSPSFISKAPSLSDRIKVEVVNPTSTEAQIIE